MINVYSPLQKGLGDWIKNSKTVFSVHDADVVMIPGGADIDPALYGHKRLKSTFVNSMDDTLELSLINRAIESNKFIVGICKGLQMLTVRAGGWLIQDVSNHHGHHELITQDGKELVVNSVHHQMCYPFGLPDDEYELLGWAPGLSSKYVAPIEDIGEKIHPSNTDGGYFKEPEIIYYPKLHGLGIQGHPEYSSIPEETNSYFNELITQFL